MRSRKWFFNLTVLKKNITRFAPLWAIYGVIQILSKLTTVGVSYSGFDSTPAIMQLAFEIPAMASTNFAYALICGAVLFGDLFRSRMCNSLYAMPMRREGWLLTNLVSGLLFSFVPNLLAALLVLPMAQGLWAVPFLWLAAVTLQFLFFFGVAVLAAYCTGKRFAMVVVYFLINFFSMILYWMVESIYGVLLYGVVINADLPVALCPLIRMLDFEYLDLTYYAGKPVLTFGSVWGYTGVCAGVGLVLMGLSVLCCRRRNMECAGDFVVFQWLRPVLLVLFSLFSAMFLQLFAIPVLIGLAIGFFCAIMLLERTVRVFRKKTFLGAAILLGVYMISLPLVELDVFGIVRWLPKSQEVASVRVEVSGTELYLDAPQEIQDILEIHSACIERWEADKIEVDYYEYTADYVPVGLYYTTQLGTIRQRQYNIPAESAEGQLLQRYLSSPEAVLGDVLHSDTELMHIQWIKATDYSPIKDPGEMQSLLDAIIADCNAGKMAQPWVFQRSMRTCDLEIVYYDKDHKLWTTHITVSEDCDNIIAWAKARGIEIQWY